MSGFWFTVWEIVFSFNESVYSSSWKSSTRSPFSFLNVISPCVTYYGKSQYDFVRQGIYNLYDNNHNYKDIHAALDITVKQQIPLGLIYYQDDLESMEVKYHNLQKELVNARNYKLEDIQDNYIAKGQ